MRWKANNSSEAGTILKLLAKQGEPLFKKLDEGAKIELLQKQAKEASLKHAKNDDHHAVAS